MNMTNPNWVVLASIVFVAMLVAIGAWAYTRTRRQSERLQKHYGDEYGRTVERFGDRTKAEAALVARERRVEKLDILPLTAADATRFGQAWNSLQGSFVDNPKGVVVQADRLVAEVMTKRGYPMGDFERRAADISVDHPAVVANYRSAASIAARAESATTEDLRKAVVHYRALFEELLQAVDRNQDTVLIDQTPIATRASRLSVQS